MVHTHFTGANNKFHSNATSFSTITPYRASAGPVVTDLESQNGVLMGCWFVSVLGSLVLFSDRLLLHPGCLEMAGNQ